MSICVLKGDVDYPKALYDLENPPDKLFLKGNIELLNKRKVAIVGSRKTSIYGQWLATKLSEALSEAGICVISGMAHGIDTFAHLGALKNEGSTVAVLGNGLDICYPSNNRSLKDSIEEKGLLVSEYEDGFSPQKWTFPMRNRIIAALSEIVIVAEAGLNSGASITAEIGIDINRDVFVAPTNINNPYGLGSNKLIFDGATPIISLEDIFEKLNIKKVVDEKEISNLTDEEIKVYNVIKKLTETSSNHIHKHLNMDIKKVSVIVTILEMKGLVSTSLGKIFIRK